MATISKRWLAWLRYLIRLLVICYVSLLMHNHQTLTCSTLEEVVDGKHWYHYDDVIMTTMASQITSLTVVYSNVYSDADQRKHQSSASLAFVWGIHRDRWIPHTKGQLRGKCFRLMTSSCHNSAYPHRKSSRPFIIVATTIESKYISIPRSSFHNSN